MIISAIVLLLSHHVLHTYLIYIIEPGNTRVSTAVSLVESVTCSILTTILIVPIFFRSSTILRLYLITWMMHLILIGGSRIFWRVSRKYVTGGNKPKKTYFNSRSGTWRITLIRQMLRSDMDLEPILAVDDDPDKRKLTIADSVKVQGTIEDIPYLTNKFKIKRIIIAIPTLSASRYKEINDICTSTGIELFKMPSIEDVLSGVGS